MAALLHARKETVGEAMAWRGVMVKEMVVMTTKAARFHARVAMVEAATSAAAMSAAAKSAEAKSAEAKSAAAKSVKAKSKGKTSV